VKAREGLAPVREHVNQPADADVFDRKIREEPVLDDAEIADIIAFPGTPTDGYRAASTDRP
jgi:hypothetical protein